MSYFTLQPLVVGVFPSFKLANFIHGAAPEEFAPAPCLAWLARGDKGELIVVDTGPGDPNGPAAHLHTPHTRDHDQRIDVALQKAGVDPAEVATAIFTHLHFDHCADLNLLPNAELYVQRSELQYAVAPPMTNSIAYDWGRRGITPTWLQGFDRLRPLDGDTELVDGVNVLHTPGHSPGSTSIVFRTRVGRYAIAGDLVNRVENWEGDAENRHLAPGFHTNLEQCFSSYAKLESAADVVLASHDFRTLDRSSYP